MVKGLVSVVIPVYNEEKVIGKCLSSLLKQSYSESKIEIIVVDDGSKDNTRKIVGEYSKKNKKIKLIEGEHKGPGFSRNLGVKKARGEILVFVDADMVLEKDYLKYLVGPILEGKVIGTEEKKQIASNPENIWSRCWGAYAKDQEGNKGRIFRAILKSEFERLGGFDPRHGYADDMTFFIKFGLESQIAEKAFCYHKNPETLKEVYKQSRWIGASLQKRGVKGVVGYFTPFVLILVAILAIPLLAIKKSREIDNWKLFFPWMLIFMSVRYVGTLDGIFRRKYFGKNIR